MRLLMCPPEFFDVEYVINPWMQGQVHHTDSRVAQTQWGRLYALLSEQAQVDLLPAVPHLPDLVFTANAALVYKNVAILSNFRCPERRPETAHNAAWFASAGFTVRHLPPEVFFEGAGDALLDRAQPLLWLGHGFRSHVSSQSFLEDITGLAVQPLQLRDSRFYHLDTCFCPLESGYLLYFPGAFDEAGNAAIEARVPGSHRLALPESEAIQFACNAVNSGRNVILNQAGPATKAWLAERGFDVVESCLQEFMKSGGAAKCLSLRLNED